MFMFLTNEFIEPHEYVMYRNQNVINYRIHWTPEIQYIEQNLNKYKSLD